jgi:hypothetical protein
LDEKIIFIFFLIGREVKLNKKADDDEMWCHFEYNYNILDKKDVMCDFFRGDDEILA